MKIIFPDHVSAMSALFGDKWPGSDCALQFDGVDVIYVLREGARKQGTGRYCAGTGRYILSDKKTGEYVYSSRPVKS